VEKRFGGRAAFTAVSRRHLAIVTGTDPADTSFLVHLLTNLGLDSGNQGTCKETAPNRGAGRGGDIMHQDLLYIVKGVSFGDLIETLAAETSIVMDYTIVSLRGPDAAIESRRHAKRTSNAKCDVSDDSNAQEGERQSGDRARQESILAREFHKLLLGLSKTEAEILLLHDPRLTRDPHYLYAKLRPLLGRSITPERFCTVFARTVNSGLVQHPMAEHE
jgi:hypothetical protein